MTIAVCHVRDSATRTEEVSWFVGLFDLVAPRLRGPGDMDPAPAGSLSSDLCLAGDGECPQIGSVFLCTSCHRLCCLCESVSGVSSGACSGCISRAEGFVRA